MATTFETLLGEIATEIHELVSSTRETTRFASGKATAGTTTTITDTNNRFELDDNSIIGSWIRVLSDTNNTINEGSISKITAFNTTTKVITFSPALPVAATVTTIYQIFRYIHPSTYVDAINFATRKAFPFVYKRMLDTSLTYLPNTWQYDVPTGIDIVTSIEMQTTNSIATYPYVDIPFEVEWDGDVGSIQLFDYYQPNYTMRVKGIGHLTELTGMSGSIETNYDNLLPIVKLAASYLFSRSAGLAIFGDVQKHMQLAADAENEGMRLAREHRMPFPRLKRRRDPRYSQYIGSAI